MELVELQPDFEHAGDTDFDVENQIQRRKSSELSYNEFYWEFMKAERNIPVVLTSVSNNWECRRNWTHIPIGSEKRTINFDYLKRTINNVMVPIADCMTEYFNSHKKLEMRFHDFLDYWIECIQRKSSTTSETEIETNSNTTSCDIKNLYLKDWHLKAQMPNYDFYCVPKYFASDFLNEYLIANDRDDYRFVYMGPKGSWTPFHADVFGSYSWSTNIIGCKKWLLLPPGEELKLVNRGKLPFEIDEALLQEKNVRFFTIYQEENESIFVPSGWYHQIWYNLALSLREVIAEIDDCRQMDNFSDHCQTMQRVSFGMNYLDFLDMLEFLIKSRIENGIENGNLETSSNFMVFDKYTFNGFHMQYDLKNIKSVLETMLEDSIIFNNQAVLYRQCVNLLKSIQKTSF